jgi:hypothetical protein
MSIEEKRLAKIKSIRVGMGGYQEAMFGITFDLGGGCWGVGDFWGFWSPARMKRSEHAKWTEAERLGGISDAFIRLDQLLADAKVDDATKLAGVPIEVTLEGNTLKSWRVLKEVL